MKRLLSSLLLCTLAACGGGGSSNNTSSNSTGTGPTATPASTGNPAATPVANDPISLAIANGDASALNDPQALMQLAYTRAVSLTQSQTLRIQALYTGVSSEYLPTNQSQLIVPVNFETAQPLIVGDGGQRLASLSITANGRGAGMGVNVLEQFRNNNNLAYAPAFRRVLAWLTTGDAAAALPATLNISIEGLNAANTLSGLSKGGVTAVNAACSAIADDACAARVQLIIVSGGIAADSSLTARIRALMQAGKPVLYLHSNAWGDSASGRQLLAGMDLDLGGYGGNYWSNDKVAAGRSVNANVVTNPSAATLALLQRLASNTLRTDFDWSKCESSVGTTSCDKVPGLYDEVVNPAEAIRTQLNTYNTNARALFDTPDTTLLRQLSLWADITRKQISYPLDKISNTAAFQRALVADAWISYVRSQGGRQTDLGTFIGNASLPVSTSDETLSITLAADSGFTALGRFAVPGQQLQVTLIDGGSASLALRINTQGTGSSRIWNPNRFDRPRYLASPAINLATGNLVPVVSPYGGTLQLQFSGATAGQIVKLRVRGVAKQPFLDLSSNGDRAAFVTSLSNTAFDWAEIKMAGVEIHTRVDKMREVLASSTYGNDMNRYLDELNSLFFDDAYSLAGFARQGKTLPSAVQAFCTARSWDCTDSTLHRAPGVQHINVDVYANCGAGCSGNPYSQNWGLQPRGWGESHELGHNLQKGVLNVYGGRSGEVSNNLFPLHKGWRMLRELGADLNADRVNYRSAFNLLAASVTNATPVDAAYQALWADDSYAVQNGERMAFYMQWIHYWHARTGDITRAWDIVTLLYLHQRLLANADWASNKAALGYSQYTTKPDVDGNDNLLLALSTITQRDQRPTFNLWGIKYSTAADAQVASYGYAVEPAFFYANTSSNNYSTVRKVLMPNGSTPVWPF